MWSSIHRAMLGLLLTLLLLLYPALSAKDKAEEKMEKLREIQRWKIFQAALECNETLVSTTRPTDGDYCDAVFDNILCWPYTPAGVVASQPCPAFIVNFNPNEVATRVCAEDGSWGPPPSDVNRANSSSGQQRGWTNFSACFMQPTTPKMPRSVPVLIKEHMPVITLISKVGYSISLVSLVVATAIMVKLKRLHCQRNVIHINLFVTFIVRAVICLLRDSLLVQGLGLPQDVQYDEDGAIEFNPHGPHWECKLLITLFHWALCSNYMWIFVEGLYLHTLIFFAVFDQKLVFKWYIIIGWATPFVFVIPWVMVRIFHNNTLCWNTHEKDYYWILKAPIIASICVNFFFFLNIIRALYTKLQATAAGESQRYKKLAKSTLVLIPLFGVYYIFLMIISNQNHSNPGLEVGLLYTEMTINSFQGMVVAFLFCFTNGEVRNELTKRWQRHMLRRQSLVSMRSSRAMSTTSFFLRERASISQASGAGAPRRGSKFPNVDSCLSLRSMETNGSAAGGKGVHPRIPATESSASLRTAETNGGLSGGRGGLRVPDSSPCRRRAADAGPGGGARDGARKVTVVDSDLSLRSLDGNGNSNGIAARAGTEGATVGAGVGGVGGVGVQNGETARCLEARKTEAGAAGVARSVRHGVFTGSGSGSTDNGCPPSCAAATDSLEEPCGSSEASECNAMELTPMLGEDTFFL